MFKLILNPSNLDNTRIFYNLFKLYSSSPSCYNFSTASNNNNPNSCNATNRNNRRVVVTGLGMITPLGNSISSVWNNLINSKSGLTTLNEDNYPQIHKFDLASKVIAPVAKSKDKNCDKDLYYNVENEISRSIISTTSPFIHYALSACDRALLDSKLDIKSLTNEQKERFGVCVGSGIGSIEEGYEAGLALKEKGKRGVSAYSIPRLLINLAAGQISIQHDLRGPNHSVSTACTTGAHSIGDAYRFIRYNDADRMIAGGTEASITPISMALFSRVRALSTKFNDNPVKASRPFDKDRDGFVMGEGAGILVLEELECALLRNANIYCEIVGYGLSGDAFHITSPSEDGRGAISCMKSALNNAKLNPNQIQYINAHATSTEIGDKVENYAIKQVFGEYTNKLSISSTKGSIGHLLGAAGSVEAIFSILALNTGIIPPTLNLDNPLKQEGFDLDYTGLYSKKRNDLQAVMSNSFGFGGTNATLIFKKYQP